MSHCGERVSSCPASATAIRPSAHTSRAESLASRHTATRGSQTTNRQTRQSVTLTGARGGTPAAARGGVFRFQLQASIPLVEGRHALRGEKPNPVRSTLNVETRVWGAHGGAGRGTGGSGPRLARPVRNSQRKQRTENRRVFSDVCLLSTGTDICDARLHFT